jgi:hypothetical protein
MSLEVTGRIIKIMPEVTGQGKNGTWKKQEFVVETAEQFPKKICMSVWGEKSDALKNFKLGEYVKASINIESREFNERWYTDIRAWRLQASTASDSSAGGQNEEYPQQFTNEPTATGTTGADESDDLPF